MSNKNYILTSEGSFISDDDLYHHGTKGMKLGVRRYQNEDGSLTNAGKKRYGDELTGSDKKTSSNNGSKTPRKGLIARQKDSLTQKYIAKGYSQTAAKPWYSHL